MKLKVRCPECGKTHLLHSYNAARQMACPSCKCDFVPARDAFLSCPECGSVLAAGKRLSCVECGFVVPESWLRRLARALHLALSFLHPFTISP
jgi:predicted RNA-binding Zn-ribbon protein involved in translation (DUF1610 family)